MVETETEQRVKPKDRKLGDEWADWRGDAPPRERDIDEKQTTFFALSAAVILMSVALLPVAWYLIKPRIVQINPFIAGLVEWFVTGFVSVLLLLLLAEGVAVLKFGKSFFPYRLMENFLLSVLPKAVWLGAKLGISRDRVGNSFIKVNNFITRSHDKLDPDRLLILLPRCLKKEARSRILGKVDGSALKVLTVAGGEEARQAIRELRPTLILALACERDLMSGIKDVADKIPVLAIPNKRPEGPCKNTDFSADELEDVMRFIEDRRNTRSSERN